MNLGKVIKCACYNSRVFKYYFLQIILVQNCFRERMPRMPLGTSMELGWTTESSERTGTLALLRAGSSAEERAEDRY
jgi:hypothetical protein